MNDQVVAVVDADEAPGAARDVAASVAAVLGADVRVVPIAGACSGADAAGQVLRALEPDRVVAAALDLGADADRCWRVLEHATKPVVIAPRGAGSPIPAIRRALLPLDGSGAAAAAVAPTVALLDHAGVDLVVVHVFTAATVPCFWDQHAHAGEAWRREFLARNRAPVGARLLLRDGGPAENVLDIARSEHADLIALGWSRRLDTGRAQTVRQLVRRARIPILLVPVGPESQDVRPGSSRARSGVLEG